MHDNTPENASTSWRDLTDQLTPEQIAYLEDQELNPRTYFQSVELPDGRTVRRLLPPSPEDLRRTLLDRARAEARNNLGIAMIGDFPTPAGATKVYDWQEADTPDAARLFDIASRKVGDDIEVESSGLQYVDGRVQHAIRMLNLPPDDLITVEAARRLAAALLDAADEIDQFAGQPS